VVIGSQVRLPAACDEMFSGLRVRLICPPTQFFFFKKCLHVSAEISIKQNDHIPVFTGGKVLPYQLKVPNSHSATVRFHFVKSLIHRRVITANRPTKCPTSVNLKENEMFISHYV
jgi:hypothetical protein